VPGAPGGPAPAAASGGLSDNAASALCYVLGVVTGIIFLVIAPYNKNKTVRFHAFQSIFLHIASILIYFVLGAVLTATMHLVGVMLMPLIGLGMLILWIFMIVKAYQGQKIVLPVIGKLAEQQA
jgi:uncharacterized membrane protein